MPGITPCTKLAWKNHSLDFSKKIYIMGIINFTPDSFYPGSRISSIDFALTRAAEMIAEGADILDIGGESTRPGSLAVDASEEIKRVVPLIHEIKARHDIIVSVDTKKSGVAAAALEAGTDMINTVAGLRDDDEFARLVARADVPVVIMHMKGIPQSMQDKPFYNDPVAEISAELESLCAHAMECKVARDKIIIDPGIGFGKRVSDNLAILANIPAFASLGFPILIGLSRKSFLGEVTHRPVEERLAGTVAAHAMAVAGGVNFLRVHDVAEAVDAAAVAMAIKNAAIKDK
ncbi:MAG: dihydropteroate synthase [Spirochaetaceae bacterium]|nr:MAG: dihydropteroate synthase [Spirochaetaceae bacterium]